MLRNSWARADRVERLHKRLTSLGVAVIEPSDELSVEEASRAPWAFAERLVGEAPRMVERQPIKAVPQGRSFASSAGPAPLHTDSQWYAGAPPDVQVMVCKTPAAEGGEHVFVDGLDLLDRIRVSEPDLYRALFEVKRRFSFVFGDVHAPTAAAHRGRFALTHAPALDPGDAVGQRLALWINGASRVRVATRRGEVLVADNHRMLHGRDAFRGEREYTRLLVWTKRALSPPSVHSAYAAALAAPADEGEGGLEERGLLIVLEMLRGVPPGVLAAREGIAEPVLYKMRDEAMAAARAAATRLLVPATPASGS